MSDPGFQPFDVHKPVRKYWRDLPHWRQTGATYFVTFRLWDSLPQPMLEQLSALRRSVERHEGQEDLWLEADRRLFLMLKRFLQAGHGACFMRDANAKAIVEGALRHFDQQRYWLGELAVLPNHVHVIVRPLGTVELEDILHSWKSYTAKAINKPLGRSGHVWQEEAYDRIVRNHLELNRIKRYIRNNTP